MRPCEHTPEPLRTAGHAEAARDVDEARGIPSRGLASRWQPHRGRGWERRPDRAAARREARGSGARVLGDQA